MPEPEPTLFDDQAKFDEQERVRRLIAETKESATPEAVEARLKKKQTQLDLAKQQRLQAETARQAEIERAREQGIDIRTPEEIQASINQRGLDRARGALEGSNNIEQDPS